MLQAIRDRVQGWVATVIFALLIIPFAFWGINYYFDGGGADVAIKVNDQEISLAAYQRALQTARQRWQEVAGTSPTGEQETLVREQAVKGLIEQALLDQFSARLGLQAGHDEVRDIIQHVGAFQGVNGFDQTIYEMSLRQAGFTPAGFEAQVRQDLLAGQLRSALVETGFVTNGELERALRLRYQTRDLRHAVLSADPAKESVQVSEADIKNYYDTHDADFSEPEKVRIGYVELSLADVSGEVEVTEEALQDYYQQNQANYSVPEQRQVKQLLVPVPKDAPEERWAGAMSLAEELRKRVVAGEPMETIAEQHPEDGDHAVEFTEFGFLSRDVLEKPVEDVAFGLEEGAVSTPVRSGFGVHVLQVTEIRGGTVATFEEVREQVEEEYRRTEAQTRFYEKADQLANLSFEHPDTLEFAAEAVGVRVRESGYLTRDGEGGTDVTADPRVLEAAFSERVLRDGENSDLVELEPEHVLVLRVLEHVPSRKIPLEQVRERVVTRLKFERARDETGERGRAAIKRLNEGASPEDVAGELGIEWQQASAVKRDDPTVNRAVLRTAFGVGRPQGDKPIYDGVSLGSGDFALVGVIAVHDPDLDAIPDAERNRAHDELLQRHAIQGWLGLMAELERTAEITVRRDNLQ